MIVTAEDYTCEGKVPKLTLVSPHRLEASFPPSGAQRSRIGIFRFIAFDGPVVISQVVFNPRLLAMQQSRLHTHIL